jgi:hypothetical protein
MEWLHFCDFHVGGKRGPIKEALASQLAAVKALSEKESWKIDAVFLVGDIAYSGAKDEYDSFTTLFLKPLRALPALAGAKFFAVPGNHDIACDDTIPTTWEVIGERKNHFFCEDADGLKARKVRAVGFENYSQFIVENQLLGPNPLKEVSVFHAIDSFPFNILTTTTAFFSDKSENSSLPNTPIPLASLRDRLSSAPTDKPVFILGHHSMLSFRRDHETQLTKLLRESNAVYFHGHEHVTQAEFATKGILKCLGFGAAYLEPLAGRTDAIYKHAFTYCKLTSRLNVRAFTWEAGEFIDTTGVQFSELDSEKDDKGVSVKVADIPLISQVRKSTLNSTALSKISRTQAVPIRLIPIGALNLEAWGHILMASETIRTISQRGTPSLQTLPGDGGKAHYSLEADEKRYLLVCIPAINHVLSVKEIEGFNTRLDTEDFHGVIVLTLGKISEEARTMYVRLRTKKPIEVLDNKDLTDASGKILSASQHKVLAGLDSASVQIHVLISELEVFALVVDASKEAISFYIIGHDGQLLPPTDELVTRLRIGTPEFEKMNYAGEIPSIVQRGHQSFDETSYLQACRKEYNSIKYAALATVGIRFADLPLDDLYVEATASEIEGVTTNRLETVVGDHLATFPASDSLKSHIRNELLTRFGKNTHKETSYAREFCQRYGVVLVVGDPGSGKTCFVKNEILSYCERGRKDNGTPVNSNDWYSSHVPVMILLSEAAGEKDLEAKGLLAIASRLLERRGFSFPETDLEVYSKQGKIAWFFDGLDEVVSVERRAVIVQHINEMVTKSLVTGDRVTVTSRPAAIHVVNLLPSLHKLEIQGLSEENIRTLAENILKLKLVETSDGVVLDNGGNASRTNESLINQLLLDCKQNPGVGRLAQNPLLLTLLILIYANAGAPSAKRHRIYEQAIQTLATVRGREAGHAKVSAVSAEDLRQRLGAVALSVYNKTSGLLPSRDEVCEVVRNVMTQQRNETVGPNEANAFIQKVAETTGLIAIETRAGEPDGSAIVTFMHHSFLEYFAAIGLSRDLQSRDICVLVHQPRWHEVLTLLAGVIGENADVSPILTKVLEAGGKLPDIDAKLLTFAIDCALECDVPSESAQRLLISAIKKNVCEGPAKLDPWVRSELGTRIGKLLAVCGEGEMDGALAELIRATNSEISSAAIHISGYVCADICESHSILLAVQQSATRIEENVLCAICAAAAKSPFLRTEPIRQVIARCLRKSPQCKRAALEAISDIPGLASHHWEEIIENMGADNRYLSEAAGQAALRAGLNADVISLQMPKKDVLLRVLNSSDGFSRNSNFTAPKIKIDTIDVMWTSALATERLLAIQLLPFTNASEQYLYDRLIGIVRNSKDRKEIVAALIAIRDGSASALLKQEDLKKIVQWLQEGTADVRVAAIQLLGSFGAELISVEALISRSFRDLNLDEYTSTIHALGFVTALPELVSARLFDELAYFLKEDRKLDKPNSRMLQAVYSALRNMNRAAKGHLVVKVKEFIGDFRYDAELKRAAILCLPAITDPTPESLSFLTKMFPMQIVGLERALVQIPSAVAQKCKQNVEFVVECIEALSDMRNAALELYLRLAKRAVSDETEFFVTKLRAGIDELTQIIVAFDEFIKKPQGIACDLR